MADEKMSSSSSPLGKEGERLSRMHFVCVLLLSTLEKLRMAREGGMDGEAKDVPPELLSQVANITIEVLMMINAVLQQNMCEYESLDETCEHQRSNGKREDQRRLLRLRVLVLLQNIGEMEEYLANVAVILQRMVLKVENFFGVYDPSKVLVELSPLLTGLSILVSGKEGGPRMVPPPTSSELPSIVLEITAVRPTPSTRDSDLELRPVIPDIIGRAFWAKVRVLTPFCFAFILFISVSSEASTYEDWKKHNVT
jgi:hypothetical protein